MPPTNARSRRFLSMRTFAGAVFLATACANRSPTDRTGPPVSDAGVLPDGGSQGDAGPGDGGGLPTVGVLSATYPTAGAPFEAIATSTGAVFVSVSESSAVGVQLFEPFNGGLKATCVNALPSSLVA